MAETRASCCEYEIHSFIIHEFDQSGFNFHSQVSTSKGAIEGLTKALAAEFAPKIRVNTIAPSITDTPLASKLLNTDQKIEANGKRHPLGRFGNPEDIAQAASFLLSENHILDMLLLILEK